MNPRSVGSARVLVVDDEDRTVDAERSLLRSSRVEMRVVHPKEVEEVHLLNADLVLVDYRLDGWAARDSPSVPISQRPQSGVSLATILQEHIRSLKKDQPTAVALHTAHLDDLLGPHLSLGVSRNVIARFHGLEWVFEKSDPRRWDQMSILAKAVWEIPNSWPTHEQSAMDLAVKLLDIDANHRSFFRCWRSIFDCQVPLGALTSDANGIQFLRWLLHQILPYPTFLLDEFRVAARLDISVDDFQEVVNDGKCRLARDLDSFSYSGVLTGFLGDRWWEGMLEDYIWELMNDVGNGRKNVREELSRRAEGKHFSGIVPDPVVVLDASTFKPKRTFVSAPRVVRIRPEHWPSFADPAWLQIESVKNDSSLLRMVDLLDRGVLEEEHDG